MILRSQTLTDCHVLSHVLELENRIRYLENLLSQHCPSVDFSSTGPLVELRSRQRPTPPLIRLDITTAQHHRLGSSIGSSPLSTSTPSSFEFSPGAGGPLSFMPLRSPALSPCSFSEPPASRMPSPIPSLMAPHPSHNFDFRMGIGRGFHQGHGEGGRRGSFTIARGDIGELGNSLPQDIGLIALSLTEDSSRYVGASSGYEFAKTVFADFPTPDSTRKDEENPSLRRRSTGSINTRTDNPSAGASGPQSMHSKNRRSSAEGGHGSPERKRGRWTDVKSSSPLPSVEYSNTLVSTFFETVIPFYPFLERNTFEACREVVYFSEKGASESFSVLKRTPSIPYLPPNFTLQVARFYVFMVFSISSSVLSAQQGRDPTDDDSEGYFISAMAHIENDEVKLRGSLQGLQSLLLMAMYALHVDGGGGLNIWHLNSTLVAGCVELGLHKNSVVSSSGKAGHTHTGSDSSLVLLNRRVFWSIYALDRNLGIMLGRPFALDESDCDVELPETFLADTRAGPGFMDRLSVQGSHLPGIHVDESVDALSFQETVTLMHLTRITSLIKSTLYRIGPVRPNGYLTPHWLQHLETSSQHNQIAEDILEWQRVIYSYLTELRKNSQNITLGQAQQSNATNVVSHAVELKYHEAIQLLYRPTQVIPRPSAQDARRCLASTIETIQIYERLKKHGGMSHTWLSAQWVFLSGLSMMWSFKISWPVLRGEPGTIVEKMQILRDDVRTCSRLLEEFGVRWKVMQLAKDRFDEVAEVTLGFLSDKLVPQLLLTPTPSEFIGTVQPLSPRRPYSTVQSEAGLSQLPTTQQLQHQSFNDSQMMNVLNTSSSNVLRDDLGSPSYDFPHPSLDPPAQLSGPPFSPVDSSLLSTPVDIPIIRQSPTPTSETPTPQNPNPQGAPGENWNLGLPFALPSQLPQQTEFSDQSSNQEGWDEMEFSWFPDMEPIYSSILVAPTPQLRQGNTLGFDLLASTEDIDIPNLEYEQSTYQG